MGTKFLPLLTKLIPERISSRLCGRLSHITTPPIKNFFIWLFTRLYDVNLSEARVEDKYAYLSYHDFFTRKLKPEARPIDNHPSSIASPADSIIYDFGNIKTDGVFQIKGHRYSLEMLLANSPQVEKFKSGAYCCQYLAPNHYHRVHAPLSGQLIEMTYVPGRLFSVNPDIADKTPNVFSLNERVICHFESPHGPFCVILVGAMNVGHIHINWHGDVTPTNSQSVETWPYEEHTPPIKVNKGDELGFFGMGSTVITLLPSQSIDWTHEQGVETRFGQAIASWHPASSK